MTYDDEGSYYQPPQRPQNPGDQGYRLPGWDAGYNPGPNWNNGVAPAPSDPYQNYNSGSPVDAPLQAGYGWEWSGAQTNHPRPWEPVFNSESGNWDYGRWNQVQGRGLGFQAPATNTGGGGGSAPAPSGGGSVPAIPASPIQVPSASLPSDVQSVFNQVPQKTPVQSAYQDALLRFMSQAEKTPSLNDPILGPQSEVYRVTQQRNQERNRRGAVERASASGMNQSGYVDRQIDKGRQQQNFNTAQYNAALVGGEMERRRKELQAALQLAAATGDAESARELQQRLAQVSAMMQQQGLNLQGQLGSGDLSLRLMQTLLGNDQFYDQLGVNTALNMEGLNQRALQTILGGL